MRIFHSKLYIALKIAEGILICKEDLDVKLITGVETMSQIFKKMPDI